MKFLSFKNNFHPTCKIHKYGFLSYVFENLKYYMIDVLKIRMHSTPMHWMNEIRV
jgi:hypothetical protein